MKILSRTRMNCSQITITPSGCTSKEEPLAVTSWGITPPKDWWHQGSLSKWDAIPIWYWCRLTLSLKLRAKMGIMKFLGWMSSNGYSLEFHFKVSSGSQWNTAERPTDKQLRDISLEKPHTWPRFPRYGCSTAYPLVI